MVHVHPGAEPFNDMGGPTLESVARWKGYAKPGDTGGRLLGFTHDAAGDWVWRVGEYAYRPSDVDLYGDCNRIVGEIGKTEEPRSVVTADGETEVIKQAPPPPPKPILDHMRAVCAVTVHPDAAPYAVKPDFPDRLMNMKGFVRPILGPLPLEAYLRLATGEVVVLRRNEYAYYKWDVDLHGDCDTPVLPSELFGMPYLEHTPLQAKQP